MIRFIISYIIYYNHVLHYNYISVTPLKLRGLSSEIGIFSCSPCNFLPYFSRAIPHCVHLPWSFSTIKPPLPLMKSGHSHKFSTLPHAVFCFSNHNLIRSISVMRNTSKLKILFMTQTTNKVMRFCVMEAVTSCLSPVVSKCSLPY